MMETVSFELLQTCFIELRTLRKSLMTWKGFDRVAGEKLSHVDSVFDGVVGFNAWVITRHWSSFATRV